MIDASTAKPTPDHEDQPEFAEAPHREVRRQPPVKAHAADITIAGIHVEHRGATSARLANTMVAVVEAIAPKRMVGMPEQGEDGEAGEERRNRRSAS